MSQTCVIDSEMQEPNSWWWVFWNLIAWQRYWLILPSQLSSHTRSISKVIKFYV